MKTLLALSLLLFPSATLLRADLSGSIDPTSVAGDEHGTLTWTGGDGSVSFDLGSVTVGFDLSALSEAPGEKYLYGATTFDTTGELSGGVNVDGGPGGIFTPGVPKDAYSAGGASGTLGVLYEGSLIPVHYEVSWYIPMDWDGTSFSGPGTWTAAYTDPRSQSVPEGLNTAAMLAAMLAAIAFMASRRPAASGRLLS